HFSVSTIPAPPTPPLFPYTTLFRSPTTRACQQVVRVARKLKLPVVLFTLQNVDVSLPFFPRVRRRRALRRLRGAIAGSAGAAALDRKSTRLNSSHQIISYAVFCLKK